MGPDGFGRSRTRHIGTDRMGPKGLDGFITVSTMVWQSWLERVVENSQQMEQEPAGEVRDATS